MKIVVIGGTGLMLDTVRDDYVTQHHAS